jgi:hypothetical protein
MLKLGDGMDRWIFKGRFLYNSLGMGYWTRTFSDSKHSYSFLSSKEVILFVLIRYAFLTGQYLTENQLYGLKKSVDQILYLPHPFLPQLQLLQQQPKVVQNQKRKRINKYANFYLK